MEVSGLELVRRYRELIGDRRVDEALALFEEDFELVTPQGTLGYSEVEQMLSEPDEGFDHLELEIVPVGLQDVGEGRFLGESDYVFRWKETGEISNVEHRAMLYTVAEGKIRRMRFYVKVEEAWSDAGVEKP